MAKAKNLVIVESPAKAKTIGKYLGPDYQVKASMGHLRDLPKSTLGVDVDGDFTPNYKPIKGKEDIIKDLKTAAKGSQTVYLATDPDREGEAISWHLKYLLYRGLSALAPAVEEDPAGSVGGPCPVRGHASGGGAGEGDR